MRNEIFEYLQRLGTHLARKGGAQNSSVSVPVGNGRMLLSPEMQKMVVDCADGQPEPKGDYRDLVLEGLGLEIKSLAEIRDAERADENGLPLALALLSENLELISDLQMRAHGELSDLTSPGDLEQAKALADYRKRLTPVTSAVEEAARRLDPSFTVEEGGEPVAVKAPPRPVSEARPDRQSDFKRDRRSAAQKAEDARLEVLASKKEQAKQFKLLIGAIGIFALTGWILWVQYGSVRAIDELGSTDFIDQKTIVQVISRPPELVLVADEKKWGEMSISDRMTIANQLVPRLQDAGYKSMRVIVGVEAHAATWSKGAEPAVK